MSGFDERDTVDTGRVIAIDGQHAKIEIQRGEACGDCAMKGFCFKKADSTVFDVQTELKLKIGDQVQLEIHPGARIGSALLIFGMPLLLLFVAFLIAQRFFPELISVGIAFGAMAVGFLILGVVDKRYGKRIKISVGEIVDHQTE